MSVVRWKSCLARAWAIRREGAGYVAAVQWHPEFHDPQDSATLDDTPMLMDFFAAARAAQ